MCIHWFGLEYNTTVIKIITTINNKCNYISFHSGTYMNNTAYKVSNHNNCQENCCQINV